jgi:glucans biosynthesis protein C
MPEANLALRNLRAVLIVLILAFHSFSAYIVSQPVHPFDFDLAPRDWRVFPIIDDQRWIGFDIFCAFQFLYLMQLMFFLSGLFVWPSLQRKGCRNFLGHRIVRLGVPFILGVYVLMPVAYAPVYLVSAVDPSWSAFWSHWRRLPLTPTGPMWFLWFLIMLNIGAAVVFRLAPGAGRVLAPLLAKAATYPGRFLAVVVCLTAAAYFPLSAIYSPWKWVEFGPFEVQATFAPQYILYFIFGVAVGAYGYDRGLLAADGALVRHWAIWVAGSFAAFLLWIIPAALIVKGPSASIPGLGVTSDLGLVIFAGAACFGMTAVFLRFATARSPLLDNISENAYGIYSFHYLFVLWLQFFLLGVAFPAIGKGLFVFAVTLTLSWTASAITNRFLASAGLLLGRSAPLFGTPSTASSGVSETNPRAPTS